MKAKRDREKDESETAKEEIIGRENSEQIGRFRRFLVVVIKGTKAF